MTKIGYENIATAVGVDKKFGDIAHSITGLSIGGYGLIRKIPVKKYSGSVLQHTARVNAFTQASRSELTVNAVGAVQAINFIKENSE